MSAPTSKTASRGEDYSTQRLTQRYRFDDVNMDLFFLSALSWGPTGGLYVGEAYYVASQIEDGNAASWAAAFERQGGILQQQADDWLAKAVGGDQNPNKALVRNAGEARLKAFAAYRSAWQFVVPGEDFVRIFHTSQALFEKAMGELALGAKAFSVPYGGGQLPGHYFASTSSATAPTMLIVGGADTCHEDRFLSQGRYYLTRGYAVALVDLPGQGIVQAQNLFWEPETDKPMAAVLDLLESQFGIDRKRTALLGMSLGGYFVSRVAAAPDALGLGAIIATPVLTKPEALFALAAEAAQLKEVAGEDGESAADDKTEELSPAAANMAVLGWKAGITSLPELVDKWKGVEVDPSTVQVPFLSVLGMQEGGLWKEQTRAWHEAIPSPKKKLITLDAETGADVHCQGNNGLRLVQEVDAFLQDILW